MKTIASVNPDKMPASITLERPASGLAGLAVTSELRSLSDSVLAQWCQEEIFERLSKHGIYPVRQVLMYGEPGNGKTTACQWLASKLDVPLYRVRCESLIDSYLGDTAKNVRIVMDWLAQADKCIVLFDECESIFLSREAKSGSDTILRELTAALGVLWQILDRWSTPQLFCFATNMKQKLDPALLSRFELQIEFKAPNNEHVELILDYRAEVFHDLGGSTLKEKLSSATYKTFRELWQRISEHVRDAALAIGKDGGK